MKELVVDYRKKGFTYEEVVEQLAKDGRAIKRARVGQLIREAKNDAALKEENEKQRQLTQEVSQVEYWDLSQAVLRNESPEKTSWINSFIEVLRGRFGFRHHEFTTSLVDYAWQMSKILEYREGNIMELQLEDDWWFRHYYTYKLAELLVWCDAAKTIDSVAAEIVRDFVHYWAQYKYNVNYVLSPEPGQDSMPMESKIRPAMDTDQLYLIIKRIQDHESRMSTTPEWYKKREARRVKTTDTAIPAESDSSLRSDRRRMTKAYRLFFIIERISMFLRECYQPSTDLGPELLDNVDLDEVRRRLDRDAAFYKLLLYEALTLRRWDVSKLNPDHWKKIESVGPNIKLSDAHNKFLNKRLNISQCINAVLNFSNLRSTERYFKDRVDSMMEHVMLVMRQRDLGHQAIELLAESLLGKSHFAGDYLERYERGFDLGAFQELEKLSEDFNKVYDLESLLIPARTREISDDESFRSDIESAYSRAD